MASESEETVPLIAGEGGSLKISYSAASCRLQKAAEVQREATSTKSRQPEPLCIRCRESHHDYVPMNGEHFHRRVRQPRPDIPPAADLDDPTGVCGFWHFCSRYISNSLYFVPVHILLLGMATSACVMGFIHWHECPLDILIAPLFVTLGLLGFVGSVLHLVRLTAKNCFSSGRFHDLLIRCLIVCGNVLFMIIYFMELFLFFNKDPNFDRGTKNYCNRVFYTYGYWMNWILLGFLLLLALLHGPGLRAYIQVWTRDQ